MENLILCYNDGITTNTSTGVVLDEHKGFWSLVQNHDDNSYGKNNGDRLVMDQKGYQIYYLKKINNDHINCESHMCL